MKLNVSRKLLLGFFSVLLLFSLVTTLTIYEFHVIDQEYTGAIDDRLHKIRLASELEKTILQQQIALRSFLANGSDDNINQLNKWRSTFSEKSQEYLNLPDIENSRKMIEELVQLEKDYQEVADLAITYKKQNKTDEITKVMRERGTILTLRITEAGERIRTYEENQLHFTSIGLSQNINQTRNIVILISIVAMILGIAIALYISRLISNPLKQIAHAAEEIAIGNLAIDEVRVKNKDEIGQLAQSFNKMRESLRDLIHDVSKTTDHVASAAEELMASAEHSTSSANQVAKAIQEVASGSEIQGRNTTECAAAVSHLATGIQRVVETTTVVSKSVEETTIQANDGNELLKQVMVQMEAIYQSANETGGVINALDHNSKEINEIVAVITSIADQTNLLALNAAIEAARAGEHGRGFSIVADEVRKLAEQSKESASKISRLIEIVQKSTSRAVEVMGTGAAEVHKGLTLVEDTGKTFDKILESVENVHSEIQEVSAISDEMAAGVEQVNAVIEEVASISKKAAITTLAVASSSEEQLATMEEVTSSSTSLANLAEELSNKVRKFKV